MQIPASLIDQVASGRVVLVLGAGSSIEARDPGGRPGPTSAQLAKQISEHFLGGAHAQLPLAQISELAASERDLVTVQQFVRSLFEDLEPQTPHLTIPKIVWSGLATTNFDTVIERAYERAGEARCQNIMPFVRNGDRVEDMLRDPNAVPYLKLHGCIDRIDDVRCPLILSPDQYVQYRQGRDRVFSHFLDWGYERTIVFIGQSLQDPDLRALLLELAEKCESRPRYYMVTPEVDDITKRFWETKRIAALTGTFSEFMREVEGSLPQHFRTLAQFQRQEMPISRHVRKPGLEWSPVVRRFITTDVEYVTEVKPESRYSEKDFYRGVSKGWAPIESGLDVNRKIADDIIAENILVDDSSESEDLQLVIIKGHAGSGKSVTLRRIAWDASHEYRRLCLFLREYGLVHADAIREIYGACQERIFVFVDDILSRAEEIDTFADALGARGTKVTIIGTARLNEWNVASAPIADLVNTEYTMPYLSEVEIDGLLQKLEVHNALGTLKDRTAAERREAFRFRYGRQLLVALHEATLGKPFEEIILDEYRNIQPLAAQQLYLTVCFLNRFDAPVRAGVISRLHNIPFDLFKERFLGPLEQVVIHAFLREDDDYVYRARHPHIAEIVFRQAALSTQEKYHLYTQCLTALNVDYKSDRDVFGKLIRARSLIEMFPNYQDVKSIFQYAIKSVPDDAFPFHQLAVYEMNRTDGNLTAAGESLAKADQLSPNNYAIQHSMAELHLRRAEASRTVLEKEKHLDDAERIARKLIRTATRQSHGFHTLCKVYLERIRLYASNDQYDDMVIARTVAAVEKILSEALQRYPDDSYLLDADAELATLLSDSERALTSLTRAFEANPRAVYAALRISRILQAQGKHVEAKQMLQRALDANPGDQRLHFLYAKLLIEQNLGDNAEVLHHLRRSFSSGDKNFVAQILFGRALFIARQFKECADFFRELRKQRLPRELTQSPMFDIPDQRFVGEVVTIRGSYAFVSLPQSRDYVFLSQYVVPAEIWDRLNSGNRVRFRVGFTAKGVNAIDLEIVD
jgi:tetratricopeptide (TPR) repeat protein